MLSIISLYKCHPGVISEGTVSQFKLSRKIFSFSSLLLLLSTKIHLSSRDEIGGKQVWGDKKASDDRFRALVKS